MASGRPRYYAPLIALVALVVAVVAFGGRDTTSSSVTTTSAAGYGLRGHPTPAIAAAIQAATNAYRSLVVQSGEAVSTATAALLADVRANRLDAARHDWAVAQSAYDHLRGPIQANSPAALEFDGRVSDLPATMGRTGLHAVEQDLYGATRKQLANDAATVATQTVVLQLSLYRTPATPSAMLTNAQLQLAWAVDDCVTQRQEVYTHLDLLDVAAEVDAVHTIVDAVTPLASAVKPSDLAAITTRLDALEHQIATLGDPLTTRDETLTTATWSRLSSQITALLEPLTTLSGDLYGYGTGRTYA